MASNSGAGAGGPGRFPTVGEIEGRMGGPTTVAERDAIRRLIANMQFQRILSEFEADLAEAQADATCSVVSPTDLRQLVMLATIAEQMTPAAGGGRRRHRQRGGGLSDATKRLLGAMCNVVRRGSAELSRQQEAALNAMAAAIESISDGTAADGLRTAFRRVLVGSATTTVIYDLSYGVEGYIGSVITALAGALYNNSPSVSAAVMSLFGAAEVAGTAAALGAGTATGVAAVTYASFLIMRGLQRAGTLARALPNPTDPAQIHDVVADVVEGLTRRQGREGVKLGAYVAPRGRGGLSGTLVIRAPPSSNAAGAAFSAAALENGQVELDAAAAADQALQATAATAGLSVQRLLQLRERNAARFGSGGGGGGAGAGAASAASASSSGGTGEMEEDGGGAGGMGGRGRRRKTRKHARRGGRRHTRKH